MNEVGEFITQHQHDIIDCFSPDAARAILESLIENYYDNDRSVIDNPDFTQDILANLVKRQGEFERFLVPWVNQRFNLKGKSIADVGCGTGSSTAAFARVSNRVKGYDISEKSIDVAHTRLNVLGCDGATVETVAPEQTIQRIAADFDGAPDVIALVAVLEHMTPAERATFLPQVWDLLKVGGIIVVAETPNRLTYFDDHTAQIPFFHILPESLRLQYLGRSPRRSLVESFQELQSRNASDAELHEAFCRWGVGLSFHDFEIGFNSENLENILIGDGYEHFAMGWWPISLEERVLLDYFLRKPIQKPLGFCRSVLNLIFVKPQQNVETRKLHHDPDYVKRLVEWHKLPEEAIDRLLYRVK